MNEKDHNRSETFIRQDNAVKIQNYLKELNAIKWIHIDKKLPLKQPSFINRTTLDVVIEKQPTFVFFRKDFIFLQVAKAISFLFKNKLLHMNIHPSCIYLLDNNLVKLGGFGNSIFITESVDDEVRQQELRSNLKKSILPKKFFQNESIIPDHSYDVWALGCLYVTMCYGKDQFTSLEPLGGEYAVAEIGKRVDKLRENSIDVMDLSLNLFFFKKVFVDNCVITVEDMIKTCDLRNYLGDFFFMNDYFENGENRYGVYKNDIKEEYFQVKSESDENLQILYLENLENSKRITILKDCENSYSKTMVMYLVYNSDHESIKNALHNEHYILETEKYVIENTDILFYESYPKLSVFKRFAYVLEKRKKFYMLQLLIIFDRLNEKGLFFNEFYEENFCVLSLIKIKICDVDRLNLFSNYESHTSDLNTHLKNRYPTNATPTSLLKWQLAVLLYWLFGDSKTLDESTINELIDTGVAKKGKRISKVVLNVVVTLLRCKTDLNKIRTTFSRSYKNSSHAFFNGTVFTSPFGNYDRIVTLNKLHCKLKKIYFNKIPSPKIIDDRYHQIRMKFAESIHKNQTLMYYRSLTILRDYPNMFNYGHMYQKSTNEMEYRLLIPSQNLPTLATFLNINNTLLVSELHLITHKLLSLLQYYNSHGYIILPPTSSEILINVNNFDAMLIANQKILIMPPNTNKESFDIKLQELYKHNTHTQPLKLDEYYCAPELLENSSINDKTNVWSVATILLEILNRDKVYKKDSSITPKLNKNSMYTPLIKNMLTLVVKDRPSATYVLSKILSFNK